MAALLVGIIFSFWGKAQSFHVLAADRSILRRATSQQLWLRAPGQASRSSTKVGRELALGSSSTPTENSCEGSTSETARGFGSRSSRRRRADGRGGPADDSKQETTLTSRQCQPQMLHVRDPIFDSRFSKSAGAAKPRKHGARVRDSPSVEILKRSSRWACVKGCGACCYLAMDQRPDMAEFLRDPQELEMFISMAAEDGWCVHYDKENRACTIYDDRPRFCRVEAETFGDMYGVEPEDMDGFCRSCCSDQIGDVYGQRSSEMRAFKSAQAALARGERPLPELNPFGGDKHEAVGRQIRDWGLDENASDVRKE